MAKTLFRYVISSDTKIVSLIEGTEFKLDESDVSVIVGKYGSVFHKGTDAWFETKEEAAIHAAEELEKEGHLKLQKAKELRRLCLADTVA
jgi:hypothetical protein